MTRIPHRFYLTEAQIPQQWYNLRADMLNLPAPMLVPNTMQPAAETDLHPVFCEELARQELDNETRYFDIPGEVMDMYRIYRPAPLVRAYNLEKELDTPAKIYFKFRGQQHLRQPQAELGHRSGVLRQAAGPHRPGDRNGRRPMGNRAFGGLLLLQDAPYRLHGENIYSAETLPQGHYGNLRRKCDREPQRPNERGAGAA